MYDLNSILLKIIEVQNKTVQKLSGIGVYKLPDNVTLAGNQFNGIEQLVQTDQNGLIPSSLYDIQYIISKVQQSINSNGSEDSGEITESDIVSLLSLPRAISEYTDEHIGEIISIPYTDESGNITGPIEFEVVGVNHHKDINDESKPTITLMSKNILRYVAFDAKEPNNPDSNRASGGNNRWSASNIRQWLNSAGASGSWFTPQHEYDTEPNSNNISSANGAYSDDPGFLTGFSDEIKQHFATVENITLLPSVDGSGTETTQDKVFLPSYTEMYGSNNNGIAEGIHLSVRYPDGSSKIKSDTFNWYWMRSPVVDSSCDVMGVDDFGYDNSCTAYGSDTGITPLLVLC